jgi:hypothetical protein
VGKLFIPEFKNDYMLDPGPPGSEPMVVAHEYDEKMLDFIDRITSPAGGEWLFIFMMYVGMVLGGNGVRDFFRMTGKSYPMPQSNYMGKDRYVGPECDFKVIFRPKIIQGFFTWYTGLQKHGIQYFSDFAKLMADGVLYKAMINEKIENAKMSPVVFKKGDPLYAAVAKLVKDRKKKKRKREDRLPRLVEI